MIAFARYRHRTWQHELRINNQTVIGYGFTAAEAELEAYREAIKRGLFV